MVWYFFIIGLLMGSFLLVVGERWSNDKSIIKPRSHCDSCQYFLHWYELIPVISYIFLRGRCKNCGNKISILCPIIELTTGLAYAFSYCYFGLTGNFIIALALFSFFIVTCVSDFKYLVILDIPLLMTCFIVLLVYMYDKGVKYFLLSLLSGFVLFAFLWAIKFIGDKKFQRESLGGGDVKLAFLIGATLHFQLAFIALVIGSLLTYPLALYYIFRKKEKEIPFGPFLIMGLIICYLFQNEFNTLLQYLVL